MRIGISFITAIALAGCQTEQSTTAGQGLAVPQLSERNSTAVSPSAEKLSIDESGRYFLVANSSERIELYETTSLRKINSTQVGGEFSSINGSGFIDSDRYFVGYVDGKRGALRAFVKIFQIEPEKQVYEHAFDAGGDVPMRVNIHYVAYRKTLIDWQKTQEPLEIWSAHPGYAGVYALTDSGRVFTSNLLGKTLLLHDPRTNQRLYWEAGIKPFDAAITRSEHHVIAVDDAGSCKVWRMPEIEPLGRCGWGALFSSTRGRVVVAPHEERFAVSIDNRVRVYSLQPYALMSEFAMPAAVTTLTLADGGRIAVADEQGNLEVWDAQAARPLGRIQLSYVEDLAFSSQDRLLALVPRDGRYSVHSYDIPSPVPANPHP
ncbi:hypothetical protein [Pseudomonas sp. RIT-PI-AD]|uniref:WD40 repeat domain-containing protein n=1 Tax=Pseudomonas sp. RIT-PI-AD TaxID=3035294 RepID=UPI0021D99682|nr:hypothetical protein [Pseudomonas sp. RIT-PI-AD]